MFRCKLLAVAGLAALLLSACVTPAGSGGTVPSEVSGTLLVGNKAEDTVSFIDLAAGVEVDRIATGPAPHEIAISPDQRHAAIVAYGGHTLDIVDVVTRKKVRTIDLSPNDEPHGIVWLDDGRIIVTTEGTQSLTIVDTGAADKIDAIRTDQPTTHMVVVGQGGRRAFTANIAGRSISVLDLVERQKVHDIPFDGRPEGLALSPDGRILWVGDLTGARVIVYDAHTYEQLAEVRTGQVPIRVIMSSDGRWVVTSNLGTGSLTVIDANTQRPVREIEISGTHLSGQVTILFSPDERRIYVAETARDSVVEVDFATGRLLRRLSAGSQADGLGLVP